MDKKRDYSMKLNRYARRKRNKKLDFIRGRKGNSIKTFSIERTQRCNPRPYHKVYIETVFLDSSDNKYSEVNLQKLYPEHFNFKYLDVKNNYYDKYRLFAKKISSYDYMIYDYQDIKVNNYNWYKRLQDNTRRLSHANGKMELRSRRRTVRKMYLNNIKSEYNNKHENLSDELLSSKYDLFEKWQWCY